VRGLITFLLVRRTRLSSNFELQNFSHVPKCPKTLIYPTLYLQKNWHTYVLSVTLDSWFIIINRLSTSEAKIKDKVEKSRIPILLILWKVEDPNPNDFSKKIDFFWTFSSRMWMTIIRLLFPHFRLKILRNLASDIIFQICSTSL
jgi:hypothetical protein